MKLQDTYEATFGAKTGTAFDYKDCGLDYRIFVTKNGDGFQWELLENKSSYGNRYETIAFDDETVYKTVEAAKRAALRTYKTL